MTKKKDKCKPVAENVPQQAKTNAPDKDTAAEKTRRTIAGLKGALTMKDKRIEALEAGLAFANKRIEALSEALREERGKSLWQRIFH